MRKSGYFIFLAFLLLAFSCESYQGDFDESVPDLYTLTTNVLPEEGGTILPSGGEFLAGENRQIVARPADGYVFDHWTGDLSGDSNPHTIQFNSNKSVTAQFSLRDYDLNLEIVGNGAVSETVVARSTSVTVRLEAEAEEEWYFDRWEGDLTGNSNPETITIEENEVKSVRAVFEPVPPEEYTVKINTQGSGSVEKSPDKEIYIEGDEITLTAKAAFGWRFIEWKGDLSGNSNPAKIIADEDKDITAVFERSILDEYSVTISTEGSGTVEKDPDKNIYTEGEEVTITAKPASGWTFSEWKGDLSGSTNPASVVVDDDMQITAVFDEVVPDEYTLNISTEGSGTVEKDPDKNVYTEGEEISITAKPASGWTFNEWRGDHSGSTNPETVIADEDKQITAVFDEVVPNEYTLNISTEGSGTVEKDPDKNVYTEGEEVTITANPASGWTFSEWRGDLLGSSNPETVIADEDKQITAVFEEDPDFGISVQEVKFYIREMDLEGARTTDDFKTKDFILNLPIDGSPFEVTHVEIPNGFYEELQLDIKKPESKIEISNPDFRDGSGSYSVIVKGVFNGVDFTYRSSEDYTIEVELSPHLEIKNGQTEIIALTIDFDEWFTTSDGGFLDPNDSGNRKQIDKKIEDSFSDFEAGF